MNNTQSVLKIVLPKIRTVLSQAGINSLVVRAYQVTHQGIPSADAVIFYQVINAPPKCFEATNQVYNAESDNFNIEHRQQSEMILRLSCRLLENPANEEPIYANDVLEQIRLRMFDESVIDSLVSQGVGVYAKGGITNVDFKNDFNQYESMPFLELGISYISGFNNTVARVIRVIGEDEPI